MMKRGFTLVELLVVLLILGVLVGLAVPRYMQSTKTAKRTTFETNLKEITKALEDYKLQREFQGFGYPPTLEALRDSGIFNKEPINPYTGKSMLSSTSTDSGLLYQSTGPTYKLCVVQRDIEDVNNNGIVDEVLPLTTKSVCIGDMRSNIQLTFIRPSVAYTSGGTQVGVNVPRFEAGKFGQAVMVEEGTTNLLQYSEDFSQSVWLKTRVDISSAGTYLNYPVTRFTPNTPGQPSDVRQTFLSSGAANRTFTWSFYARGQTNRQFTINFYGGASGTFASYTINLTTEWQKFTITHTFPSNATLACIQWGNSSPYWGVEYTDWIEVAGVQVEEKSYATSYIKTTSSTATRSPEILTIPGEVMPDNEGTITLWARKNDFQVIRLRKILDAESPRIDWQWNDTGRYCADFGGANLSVADPARDTEWHFYAITYSGRTVKLYFDGLLVASGQATQDLKSFTTLYLGTRYAPSGNWYTADAIIDDLRISSRALTDEEIAALYQSGQPAPVDANTILKADFDGNLDAQGGIIQ